MGNTGADNLLDGLFGLPAELYTAVTTVLGFALLDNLTSNQQNSLGYLFALIGNILQTNANQRFLLEAKQQSEQMKSLQCQIDELRRRLENEK
ncbi:MAG: hypothetical protein VB086_07185 [Clostridiaceae bacterium]|nr:hypothetical protein [Clostridiaceae bacterium]